jgi:SAM-dependent methyltransferase
MIDVARQKLGPETDLRVADLADPMPYADAEFDDVFCSLALHYLEDWSGPLSEFRRVLKPGGRVFISVNHPAGYAIQYRDGDYFGVSKYTEDYEFDGNTVYLTFWHRPLHAMADAFAEAGFRIAGISEPAPSPDTPSDLIPPQFVGKRFIGFLFFVLVPA